MPVVTDAEIDAPLNVTRDEGVATSALSLALSR